MSLSNNAVNVNVVNVVVTFVVNISNVTIIVLSYTFLSETVLVMLIANSNAVVINGIGINNVSSMLADH